jgi:fibronectin type 3 domain-containing protein
MLPETESLELRKQAPPNLRKIRRRGEDVRLKWKLAKGDADHPPFYYVIYRFETIIDQEMDFENPKNMLQMLPFGTNEKKYIFHDETAKEGKLYTYTVVAVNRQHAESDPSEKQRILKKDGRVKRIK